MCTKSHLIRLYYNNEAYIIYVFPNTYFIIECMNVRLHEHECMCVAPLRVSLLPSSPQKRERKKEKIYRLFHFHEHTVPSVFSYIHIY